MSLLVRISEHRAELGAKNLRTGKFLPGLSGLRSSILSRQSGDIIEVNPGVYEITSATNPLDMGMGITGNKGHVTMRSSDPRQRYVIDALHSWPNAFAIGGGEPLGPWTSRVENFHVKNARPIPSWGVAPGSGAKGVAFGWSAYLTTHPARLELFNGIIEDCCQGIFTAGNPAGNACLTSALIDSVDFRNVGCTSDVNTHGWYGVCSDTATFRGCRFWGTFPFSNPGAPAAWGAAPPIPPVDWSRPGVGHFIKDGSRVLIVEACLFDCRLSASSAPIDLWILGESHFYGNIFLGGPNSADEYDGSGVVHQSAGTRLIGWHPSLASPWPPNQIHMAQNTFVNYGDSTNQPFQLQGTGVMPLTYEFVDNITAGTWTNINDENRYPSARNTKHATTGVFHSGGFKPIVPVAGQENRALFEFVAPWGYRSRTDAFRGAIGP